ncbi:flagellar assembly protein FliH [Vibrio profundum]|uniref:flagellar assembly protein FliH n=1 Tax=Vibrio profundum TaxID=2910247 RepID=UPI003D0AD182
MAGERKRGYLRLNEDEVVKKATVWGLPDYSAEVSKEAKDTAFNYDPGWLPSVEEPEIEEPAALTAEELENIRQSAFQEGLLSGQEAGFKQGYDKGKEQGVADGHQEGFDNGKNDGLEAGQELVQTQIQNFVTIVNQFSQPLELMNDQVEKQLVDMVLRLVKEVTHVEVKINPQIILDTIKQSVECLPIAGHRVGIKLNPQDVEVAESAYNQQTREFHNWTLMPDPALSQGDVQIEISDSSVNYRIDERIKTVLHNFCEANRHQGGE